MSGGLALCRGFDPPATPTASGLEWAGLLLLLEVGRRPAGLAEWVGTFAVDSSFDDGGGLWELIRGSDLVESHSRLGLGLEGCQSGVSGWAAGFRVSSRVHEWTRGRLRLILLSSSIIIVRCMTLLRCAITLHTPTRRLIILQQKPGMDAPCS